MATVHLYFIRCDYDGKESSTPAETEARARALAADEGFVTVPDPKDSARKHKLDMCGDCKATRLDPDLTLTEIPPAEIPPAEDTGQ